MSDNKEHTYGQNVMAAAVSIIAIAGVLAVIYMIMRSLGWLGLNWG